jgi:hypothetical protein
VPIAAPALTPEVEQEVIVDTSLEAMRNGAPPRESAGRFVAPDGFIQPGDVIPDSGPALGDLLQQPFALANGGTAAALPGFRTSTGTLHRVEMPRFGSPWSRTMLAPPLSIPVMVMLSISWGRSSQ